MHHGFLKSSTVPLSIMVFKKSATVPLSIKIRSINSHVATFHLSLLIGIAALLLHGGRTAHSRFKVPLQLDKGCSCSVKAGSTLEVLLTQTKLIVWDEAPMSNALTVEALDITMREVLGRVNPALADIPFGGVVIVFGGDWNSG